MDLANFARAFKPTMSSLGYALFLAVNATGVWGGIFPFLPLEFQTPTILFWFFLAQSVAFFASFLASGLVVYFLPGPTRRLSAVLAGAPYLVGWLCLIAALYLDAAAVPLVTVGGTFLGIGSAGFYMLWQRLFASRDADVGSRDLILGTVYSALFYYALYVVPRGICAFLIPLVFMPLFGLTIALQSRTVDREQPMFQDVPREHPAVYRNVVLGYWRCALCLGVLGLCSGIMRSLAVGNLQMGALINVLSMAGALVTAVVLLRLWHVRGLRMSVTSAYRVIFPLAITAFVVLPFAPADYGNWLAAILYALYSAAVILMMIQCAQASRDGGINPVFVYGLYGAVVYALHDIGFFGGTFIKAIGGLSPDFPTLITVALGAIYLLGMMNFVSQGGIRRALGLGAPDLSIELVAFGPTDEAAETAGSLAAETAGGSAPRMLGSDGPEGTGGADGVPDDGLPANEGPSAHADHAKAGPDAQSRRAVSSAEQRPPRPGYEAEGHGAETELDETDRQIDRARVRYRLTARETEIMGLIAGGYTVPRIAEMLVVSENTVRTHSRHIYAKLGVHKKQELRDLLSRL